MDKSIAHFCFGFAASLTAAVLFLPREASATPLSDAAAAMSPGTWRTFTTNNIEPVVGSDPVNGGSDHMLTYADKLHFDPQTNRIYLINSDDPGDGRHFLAYDEPTNGWVTLPDPWGGGVAHQYGQTDIDVAGRRIYSIMPDGNSGYIYDLTTSQFSSLSMGPSVGDCCGGAAFFVDRNTLVFAQRNVIRERSSSGQWTTLSSSINTSYHAVAHYSPVNKLVIFGGGNDTSRNFYKLSQSGQITTLRSPPLALESPRIEIVSNPSDGNFLVVGFGRTLWSYNPVADTWTSLSTTGVPTALWSGAGSGANVLNTVGTTMTRYGIAFFAACENGAACNVILYKFAPAPASPNPPTALTAN